MRPLITPQLAQKLNTLFYRRRPVKQPLFNRQKLKQPEPLPPKNRPHKIPQRLPPTERSPRLTIQLAPQPPPQTPPQKPPRRVARLNRPLTRPPPPPQPQPPIRHSPQSKLCPYYTTSHISVGLFDLNRKVRRKIPPVHNPPSISRYPIAYLLSVGLLPTPK